VENVFLPLMSYRELCDRRRINVGGDFEKVENVTDRCSEYLGKSGNLIWTWKWLFCV